MDIETKIRETFARHGIPLAELGMFGAYWNALSQYGYTLSEHDSKAKAEQAVIDYYSNRMHLIRQ